MLARKRRRPPGGSGTRPSRTGPGLGELHGRPAACGPRRGDPGRWCWHTGEMSAPPLTSRGDSHAAATLPEPCVLLKLGEIVLKGKNRQQFERLLHDNIRRAVHDLSIGVQLWQREGVIVLRLAGGAGGAGAETATDLLAERMRNVMGLTRVCRAVRVAKDPEAAAAIAVQLTAGRQGSFAVRARRRDKRFPMNSSQLATLIGARIQEAHGYPVNLSHPDTTVF